MKNYAITAGNFTTNGNFSGYTALGERVFVHKRQMESQKWTKNEDVKYPFYAIGEQREFNEMDENNEPKKNDKGELVKFKRLSALSVFPTKEALINAHVEVATLDIGVKGAISAQAKSAGLTDDAVKALLEVAI